MTIPYPTLHPAHTDALQVEDLSLRYACCRFAMRRALAYLSEGTKEGTELAVGIISAVLRGDGEAK